MNIDTIKARIESSKVKLSPSETHYLYAHIGTPSLSDWVQTLEGELLPQSVCTFYNPNNEPGSHHWTRRDTAILNPFNGLYASPKLCDTLYYIDGTVMKLPSHMQSQLARFKVSRKGWIYSQGNLPLYEHTGAGIGSPKNFQKPTGESFGIEIETMFRAETPEIALANKIKFAIWLKENYPDWIVERDGSLEDGLSKINYNEFIHCCAEIVSPPMSFNELRSSIRPITLKLREYGASAQRIGDFFAIHITANIYSDGALAKMIRNVNNPQYRYFWKQASFRPQSDGFVGDVGKPYCKFDDFSNDTPDGDIIYLSTQGHYRALYSRGNGAAGELRIFQTRINSTYITDILELARINSLFAHSNSTDWAEFLRENASSSLMDYLASVRAFDQNREFTFIN